MGCSCLKQKMKNKEQSNCSNKDQIPNTPKYENERQIEELNQIEQNQENNSIQSSNNSKKRLNQVYCITNLEQNKSQQNKANEERFYLNEETYSKNNQIQEVGELEFNLISLTKDDVGKIGQSKKDNNSQNQSNANDNQGSQSAIQIQESLVNKQDQIEQNQNENQNQSDAFLFMSKQKNSNENEAHHQNSDEIDQSIQNKDLSVILNQQIQKDKNLNLNQNENNFRQDNQKEQQEQEQLQIKTTDIPLQNTEENDQQNQFEYQINNPQFHQRQVSINEMNENDIQFQNDVQQVNQNEIYNEIQMNDNKDQEEKLRRENIDFNLNPQRIREIQSERKQCNQTIKQNQNHDEKDENYENQKENIKYVNQSEIEGEQNNQNYDQNQVNIENNENDNKTDQNVIHREEKFNDNNDQGDDQNNNIEDNNHYDNNDNDVKNENNDDKDNEADDVDDNDDNEENDDENDEQTDKKEENLLDEKNDEIEEKNKVNSDKNDDRNQNQIQNSYYQKEKEEKQQDEKEECENSKVFENQIENQRDNQKQIFNELEVQDDIQFQISQQISSNSQQNVSLQQSQQLNQSIRSIDQDLDESISNKSQHQDVAKSEIYQLSIASSFVSIDEFSQYDRDSVLQDQIFMANKLSLSKNYGYLDDKKIKWQRPKDFIKGDIYLFDNILPVDVIQGYLGDCYLLSSLSSLAQIKKPIRKLFNTRKYDQRGVHTINFYVDGIKRQVLVDDQIPCLYESPIFAKNNKQNIWAMLIEKAYAKYFGSYQLIESGTSGFAFKDLTGAPYERVDNTIGDDLMWKNIDLSLSQKFVLTAGSIDKKKLQTNGLDSQGIETAHAYSILGTMQLKDEDGKQVNLILLRNPWGKNPWLGNWGPTSTQWNKQSDHYKSQLLDEGYFWMSSNDFKSYFESVNICKYYPKYKYNFIKLCQQNGQVNKYAILLTFEDKTHTYLCFTQQQVRPYDKDYEYARLSVVILKRKLESNNYEKFIDSKSESSKDLFIEITLEKGVYLIYVEAFWGQNYKNKQLCFNTYGEKESQLVELEANQEYCDYLIDQIIKLHSQQIENDSRKIYKDNIFRYQSNVGNYVYFRYVNQNKDYQLKERVTLSQYDNLESLDTQYCEFEIDIRANQEKTMKYQISKYSKGAYTLNYSFKNSLIKIYNIKTLKQDCIQAGIKEQMQIQNRFIEVYFYKLTLSNGYAYYFNSDIDNPFTCNIKFQLNNLSVKVPSLGNNNIEFTLDKYNKDFMIWLEVINFNQYYQSKYSMSIKQ